MIPSKKIDYLCIGHLTEDITPDGIQIGGTAAYSTLTAKAFNVNCGLVTSYLEEELPPIFKGIKKHIQPTTHMVRFENLYKGEQRTQFVRQDTEPLLLTPILSEFKASEVTHFGPILHDFDVNTIKSFTDTFIGITPQGWLRENDNGKVIRTNWEKIKHILPLADAVVISQEDIDYNQQTIISMIQLCKLLVVTEGFHGANVYFQGEQQHFHAPSKLEVDPTGAGDIFSTAFFILNQRGYSPWEAGRIATDIASVSVTRKGLDGIPTPEEIQNCISQHSISEIR